MQADRTVDFLERAGVLGKTQIQEALSDAGFTRYFIDDCRLSLGELLAQSGLVSELERVALVEFSIAKKKSWVSCL